MADAAAWMRALQLRVAMPHDSRVTSIGLLARAIASDAPVGHAMLERVVALAVPALLGGADSLGIAVLDLLEAVLCRASGVRLAANMALYALRVADDEIRGSAVRSVDVALLSASGRAGSAA